MDSHTIEAHIKLELYYFVSRILVVYFFWNYFLDRFGILPISLGETIILVMFGFYLTTAWFRKLKGITL